MVAVFFWLGRGIEQRKATCKEVVRTGVEARKDVRSRFFFFRIGWLAQKFFPVRIVPFPKLLSHGLGSCFERERKAAHIWEVEEELFSDRLG